MVLLIAIQLVIYYLLVIMHNFIMVTPVYAPFTPS